MSEILIENSKVIFNSSSKSLLEIMNFSVKRGESVCIMGANGSGKTSFLKSIIGYQLKFSGRATVDGLDLYAMSNLERAKKISYLESSLPADCELLVGEVINLGRYCHRKELNDDQEAKLLFDSILSEFGLKHLVDRSFSVLSDGQKKLVLLARAVFQDPSFLLLDEPSNFIDANNKNLQINILKNLILKKNKGLLFTTHDFNIALALACKVYLIENELLQEPIAPEEYLLRKMSEEKVIILELINSNYEYDESYDEFIEDQSNYRWLTALALRKHGIDKNILKKEKIKIRINYQELNWSYCHHDNWIRGDLLKIMSLLKKL